jgi:hypothetical protein
VFKKVARDSKIQEAQRKRSMTKERQIWKRLCPLCFLKYLELVKTLKMTIPPLFTKGGKGGFESCG